MGQEMAAMKMLRYFVVIVVCFLWCSSPAFCHAEESILPNEGVFTVGAYEITKADRQRLANKIADLLHMTTDNLERVPNKKPAEYKEVDLNTRKKFFSEEGWKDYTKYLNEQQDILQKRGAHWRAGCRLNTDTAQYTSSANGQIILYAEDFIGYYYQESWCDSGVNLPSIPVRITLSFSVPVPANTDNFIFNKWKVEFLPETFSRSQKAPE